MTAPATARFAVIADTHLEPASHAVANIRARRVVEAIRRRAPDFVLHLGDVVHPLPGDPGHAGAEAQAAEILGALEMPVHYVPGNHDIGDKPLPAQPAKKVRPEYLDHWCRRYGRDAGITDIAGLRLVCLNAPLLSDDPEQVARLAALLDAARQGLEARRLVVVSHYPPYLHDAGEPSHYDNIAPASRECLLAFCREASVDCVFSGHIHNHLFARHGETRLYGAPSTAFVRRDYAELYRAAYDEDFGREDPCKLGFLWAEDRGGRIEADMVSLPDLAAFEAGDYPPARPAAAGNLGVNLRHDWAETVDLPFNPPTGTFTRRKLRDDYTLRLLRETGMARVRFPLGDLDSAEHRARAGDLRALGIALQAFTEMTPADQARLEGPAAGLVDVLELIVPQRAGAGAEVAAFLQDLPHPPALAAGFLQDYEAAAPAYQHQIGYGLLPAADAWRDLCAALPGLPVPALVLAFPMDGIGPEQLAPAEALEPHGGLVVLAERRSEGTLRGTGDEVLALMLERLLRLVETRPGTAFVLDTLVGLDRGYHARAGLADRFLNPTPAGNLLRHRAPRRPDGDR